MAADFFAGAGRFWCVFSEKEPRMSEAIAPEKIAPSPSEIGLWRLPTVLANVPVSRSGWWQGVKDGRYPKPVRLSPRCVAWRASDIRALIASFGA